MLNNTINSWEDLNISSELLRGIYNYGFEKPSPIQSKAILPILENKSMIAQAQSGTGKTATFSIGALSMINLDINEEQAIILAPTRELSKQIEDVVLQLGCFIKNLNTKLLIGGNSMYQDIQSLHNKKPHIIIGCPGRVLDFIQHKYVNINNIRLVILDEADELLSSGFQEQIYHIIKSVNITTQILLFSATIPTHLYPVVQKLFIEPPVEILVKQEELTLEGIKQYYIALYNDEEKFETLKNLYSTICVSQCIIYCNSVRRVINLYNRLSDDGFSISCIHGEMDKINRAKSFNDFRIGSTRILISSNITARGIDIQQVGIIINYDIPNDVSSYLHRIGRSGRWGRKGTGINFITKFDVNKMKEIEKYYDTEIIELPNNFTIR